MKELELRVPPPVVGLVCAVIMALLSNFAPLLPVAPPFRGLIATLVIAAGVATAVIGFVTVQRAGTTTNPTDLSGAVTLLTHGIYGVTRNPMYLGMAVALLGIAIALGGLSAYAGPALYVLYIARFQIAPEEAFLTQRFGADYAAYCARVRRWL